MEKEEKHGKDNTNKIGNMSGDNLDNTENGQGDLSENNIPEEQTENRDTDHELETDDEKSIQSNQESLPTIYKSDSPSNAIKDAFQVVHSFKVHTNMYIHLT